jgi:hypothetical protein
MLNITGRFLKVWAVEIKEKFTKVDMSSSKKNQDGSYSNSSWKGCKFVGKAFEESKTLSKGDTINVLSGLIGKRQYQDKWYDDIVVFEFEVVYNSEASNKSSGESSGFEQVDDPAIDDSLPF